MAKDLTREVPRSPLEEIGGWPWLPRLIDKVRAKQAGTLGEYTPYPCGADQRFLKTFGIDAAALEAKITGGASDVEVASWCQANCANDPVASARELRQSMMAPVAPERQAVLAKLVAELKEHRPDLDLSGIDSFTKLILVEEGHPVP